jgi:hypothetical protein
MRGRPTPCTPWRDCALRQGENEGRFIRAKNKLGTGQARQGPSVHASRTARLCHAERFKPETSLGHAPHRPLLVGALARSQASSVEALIWLVSLRPDRVVSPSVRQRCGAEAGVITPWPENTNCCRARPSQAAKATPAPASSEASVAQTSNLGMYKQSTPQILAMVQRLGKLCTTRAVRGVAFAG